MTAGNLLLIGASGHGKVVAEAATSLGAWRQIAFVDDKFPELQQTLAFPVLGPVAALEGLRSDWPAAIVCVGNNATRTSLLERLRELGFEIPRIAHPTASVSASATIAEGTVILAQADVNAAATIGAGCILNTGCTVDHDSVLADGVHISPGAHVGGGVHVGARSWVGIGASVRECVHIGHDVIVGAGAAVVADTGDNITVAGVPARPIRHS